MANRWGKSGNSDRFYDFIFLRYKITADCDCIHEIKRLLLLGSKAMTNLDSILKSRDITLLTKVWIVKTLFFPVVMYEWEIWAIKKAGHRRTDTFELWFWRRLLRIPCTARRSNQSILKEIKPELEGLMLRLKSQYFGYLMWTANIGKGPDVGKSWRQEGKGATEDEMFRYYHPLNGLEFEQVLRAVMDREVWHAADHGVAKGQTRLSNWTTTTKTKHLFHQKFAFAFFISNWKYQKTFNFQDPVVCFLLLFFCQLLQQGKYQLFVTQTFFLFFLIPIDGIINYSNLEASISQIHFLTVWRSEV